MAHILDDGIVPAIVTDEIHQLWHDGKLYWLRTRVTAEPAEHPEPGTFPWFPMPAGLGERIADVIRAEVAAHDPANRS